MGIVPGRHSIPLAVVVASACGFPRPPDVGPDDAPPAGASFRLLAVTPAIATAGATISLEGTFADSATVRFPGGATQAATMLGTHRATVLVPEAATAGDLTVTTGGITIGPVAFRRTSFALGLQPFRIAYEQTDGARQSAALRIARSGATATVIGNWLYVIGGVDGSGGQLNSVERAAINADGTIDMFEIVGDVALDQARSDQTTAMVGNALYVIGGTGSGGVTSSVERATINADGSLGDFAVQPGVMLATARSGHASVIAGNAVYVIGGARSDGGKLASVERAEVQPDGSLGPFTAVDAALGQARSGHSAELIGDAVYVLGGDSGGGALTGGVERAPIDGDGSLAAFAAAGIALAVPRTGHRSTVVGGALYVVGGSTSGGVSRDVERAPIGANGALGTFAMVSTTALSAVRTGHAIAAVGAMLYAIGGRNASGLVSSAEHASLNADSTLTPFTTSSVGLVLPRVHDTSTTIRDTIYMIGRSDGTSSVERGSLLPDGQLTAFTTVPGMPLVTDRSSHNLARIGRYVYVIGGAVVGTPSIAAIERAAIHTDGSLDAFTAVSTSLVQARSGAGCVAIGNYLYVISGMALDHTRLTNVERSAIRGDGTLGPFEVVPGVTVNTGRNYFTTLVTDQFVYVVGGLDSTGGAAGIERASIGQDGSLTGFSLSGDLQSARGTHSSVVAGNTVYVIGGLLAGDHVLAIERAAIDLDGSLRAFDVASALNLTEARARHAAAIVGNHAYLLGGETVQPNGQVDAVLAVEHADLR